MCVRCPLLSRPLGAWERDVPASQGVDAASWALFPPLQMHVCVCVWVGGEAIRTRRRVHAPGVTRSERPRCTGLAGAAAQLLGPAGSRGGHLPPG